MARYDREFPERFVHGIPLNELTEELHKTLPGEDGKTPPIHRLAERIAHPDFAAAIDDQYGEDRSDGGRYCHFKWDENWNHLCPDLFDHFTTDEKCRLVFGQVVSSQLGDMMMQNDRYRIFRKIVNGFWHWGYTREYNPIVDAYNAMRTFDFGIDGFDTYLDHTTYHNDRGYAQYGKKEEKDKYGDNIRVYLDGVFAYQIHHKGKLVMTIGFTPSRYGLLIQQVQLVNPRGNRWLYKLPTHYFDHAVDRLIAAFPGWRPLIVDGKSLADTIEKAYWRTPELFSKEKHAHIVRIYQQPLQNWRRSGYRRINGCRFHYLHSKIALKLAA